MKQILKELKTFILLWSTQSLSQLGSAMTNFALVIYLYEKTGSALQTALLSICSYAPYVLMSIFAGALSDRWNRKKVMLTCDVLAAACTVTVFLLLRTDTLMPWHMYMLNAVNGLMNTVQQPASDVSMTLITPEKHFQRTSGLRSFSNSLVTILTPVLATAVLSFWGMDAVIAFDLLTFTVAFLVLLVFIRIPETTAAAKKEPLLQAARAGLAFLNRNRLILTLILFLAGVNLVASAFNATLPAMILPRENGGELVLGAVQSAAGIATLVGSVFVTLMPAPKNRVRAICITLLISLGTENFILAFTHTPVLWCVAQVCGWIVIPVMNANLDVILRTGIPAEMQGRVFSCRNTLQFFTIPLGYFLGGWMTDTVFEPLMAAQSAGSLLTNLFGSGKGSGASMMLAALGMLGTLICLVFWKILSGQQHSRASGMEPHLE
ncbi:MAG: MFS transporter [Clostridia bacterium]|nr:MFS transporter [Clostridia bacterium]